MAIQRIVLIHPGELKIPKIKNIGVTAALVKAFPQDAEKVADNIEELKITPEKVIQDMENEILMDINEDVSRENENDSEEVKALERQESKDI